MALIKKDADALHVNVEKTVDDTRKQKTITAKDRKSLRVDPDTYDTIKSLAYIKDKKIYEIENEMVEAYKRDKLSPREREIFDSMSRSAKQKSTLVYFSISVLMVDCKFNPNFLTNQSASPVKVFAM